jgi:hypothetical protein
VIAQVLADEEAETLKTATDTLWYMVEEQRTREELQTLAHLGIRIIQIIRNLVDTVDSSQENVLLVEGRGPKLNQNAEDCRNHSSVFESIPF